MGQKNRKLAYSTAPTITPYKKLQNKSYIYTPYIFSTCPDSPKNLHFIYP